MIKTMDSLAFLLPKNVPEAAIPNNAILTTINAK
jgi:hypothetical protein|tara:strand:- start:7922 stop:8023 length:102 start_codon:yes stop_codon:yes gene_type:complete